MKRLLLIAPLLAACGDGADKTASCNADGWAGVVGKPVSEIQSQLPSGTRVLGPNSVVTQDFRPDRTNVSVDAGWVVVRVWCG